MSLRGRRTEPESKVEINVVPLVDVSLVLLIIFMVTATFVQATGMHIQLPNSAAAQPNPPAQRELTIGIDAGGRFFWAGAPVDDAALNAVLRREATEHGVASRVIVAGDAHAAHGRVVRAMTLAQLAGFSRLMISTRQDGAHAE